jgi:hypothetical protein
MLLPHRMLLARLLLHSAAPFTALLVRAPGLGQHHNISFHACQLHYSQRPWRDSFDYDSAKTSTNAASLCQDTQNQSNSNTVPDELAPGSWGGVRCCGPACFVTSTLLLLLLLCCCCCCYAQSCLAPCVPLRMC